MKKITLTLIFSLTLLIPNLKSVVILVHGSYESHSQWCTPGGIFYQELEKAAKNLNQKLIPFSWSGLPTDDQIIKGAESLAKIILSYPENEKLTIIGHGHGSNVINFATQLLFDPTQDLTETNTYDNASNYPEVSILISQAYNEANTQKTPQPETTLLVKKAIETIGKLRSEKMELQEQIIQKQHKKLYIEKVCLISPPVDIKKFAPQMKIIQHVYNYYSTSEPTINLFDHEKTYPKIERLVNFKIQFLNTESFILYNPTPIEIINPILARWILFIPEKLQEEKIGFFENFTTLKDAKIQFKEGKRPVYLIN
jgi:hypothetical protein